MSSIRIGYFLEDVGQRQFLVALVGRVAMEVGIPIADLEHDVRNASGGKGRTITELGNFLRDIRRGLISPPLILIDKLPTVPPYKCERGRYKRAMKEALDEPLPLGGAELGAEIAACMDLYRTQQVDAAFKHFVDQLRSALSQCA